MKELLWFAFLSALSGLSAGAKILLLVPTPTRSHHNLLDKLAIELANRGHQATLITAFPQPKPVKNLEEIIFPNYYDKLIEAFKGKSEKQPSESAMQMNPIIGLFALHGMGSAMTEMFLSSPIIQKFLKSDRKFDLVIGEAFFVEAILGGFAKKFDAPLISLSPGLASFWVNYLVGNPAPTATVPSTILGYSTKMTFPQRVINTLFESFANIYFQTFYLPKQDSIMKKYFGHHLPYVGDIMKNTSLVLVNHHHSLAFPRPYLPNMIEIAGYHVRPPQPLPAEFKKYLDESKSGVILFSMGSHFKSSSMSPAKIQLFLNVFSHLKENVLWKYEDDKLQNLPKNVKIMKWLPQSDLLAHPNLKLFISHGGLLSTIETTMRGVPILGLPVFGDQPANIGFAETSGFGKMLDINNLSEAALYSAITEIISNTSYKENIKRVSSILNDTPMSAMDTAMYWIEYVIRHKGAPHLRSAARDLEWYELYLVDVLGAITLMIVITLWIQYAIFKCLCKKFCRSKSKNVSASKKSN